MRCLFPLLLVAVFGDIESGHLIVNAPKSLVDKYNTKYNATDGSIPMKPAMFGIPAYGHQAQLTGLAVYVPADDADGCLPINKTELVPPPAGTLMIMVVERGNCTFVTKVQHAQDAGANACIIVDNRDEARLPYMADDGNGATISIPSMLIHRDDGAHIAAAINTEGARVIMTMSWNVPHEDNIVEWEFWTNSYDPISYNFKIQFDEAAAVLGDAAAMTPHYMFENGMARDCVSPDGSRLPCGEQCTNNGRYCVFGVDPAQGPANGAAVIQENLRQICLFKYINATAPDAARTQWWNYQEDFLLQCSSKKDFTQACSERQMRNPDVGVDPAVVADCVNKSGGSGPHDGANTLLSAELSRAIEMSIFFIPTIIINGVAYRGSIDCPKNAAGSITSMTCGVLEEICLGFLNSSAIPACTSPPDCKLGQQKDPQCNICGGKGFDACGTCTQPGDKDYNLICAGCDGKPNSGKKEDECGVCDGPGRDACGNCVPAGGTRVTDTSQPGACSPPQTATVSPGVVVVIVLSLILVVGVGVFFYMRHRQRALKQDIDALLKQYLPMGERDTAGDAAARA